jgi:RNA polymerase sigma factor (sigma-70 family)
LKGELHTNIDGEELVRLLKANDLAAFEELYKRFRKPLLQKAYVILNSPEEAEDVVQEVFTELWTKRNELHIHTSIEGLLFTATGNRAITRAVRNQARKRWHSVFHQLTGATTHNQELERKELLSLMEEALQHLPKAVRETYQLHYLEDLSFDEVAAKQKISLRGVWNNVYRYRQAIRKVIIGESR